MAEPAIHVEDVWKQYNIHPFHSIWSKGMDIYRRLRKRESREHDFWALRDVNLEVQPGETLGIIGPNGAGKSTLLKILCGVTDPTRGRIKVQGRIAPLIELGAGFHPDLTGRENVFINAVMLGMSLREVRRRYDQIVEFSGIGEFMETPVKKYSSGMFVRLAFSVAIHTDPDILLVDEVLAVGDLAFRVQCYERMRELVKGGCSLVLVSHNIHDLQRICSQGMVIDKGQVVTHAPILQAIAAYDALLAQRGSEDAKWHGAYVQNVVTSKPSEEAAVPTDNAEEVEFCVTVSCEHEIPDAVMVMYFEPPNALPIASFTNKAHGVRLDLKKGENRVMIRLPRVPFLPGTYEIHVAVYEDSGKRLCQRKRNAGRLIIDGEVPDILREYFFVKMPTAEWRHQSPNA